MTQVKASFCGFFERPASLLVLTLLYGAFQRPGISWEAAIPGSRPKDCLAAALMRVVASCLNLPISTPAARRAVLTGGSGSDRVTTRAKGPTMRAFLRQASSAIRILGLHLALAGAMAQEATFPDNWSCSSDHFWKNDGIAFNFNKPVDLDRDGKADFRFVSSTAWAVHPTRLITDPLYSYFRDDTVAYFAEKHVQMYLEPVTSTCAMDTPKAVLAPGTLIPANPATTNSWQWTDPHGVPSLKGIGFGYTSRGQTFNDPHIHGGAWEPGYLRLAPQRSLTNALLGFRLQSADGWHSGWMRIRWAPTVLTIDSVKMVEYATSPLPDTDIAAGVHVGPPLQIATSTTNGTNAIRVSWPTNATNLTLEAKGSWTATNWVAVPGVTNNEVTIATLSSSAFFRLRGQ